MIDRLLFLDDDIGLCELTGKQLEIVNYWAADTLSGHEYSTQLYAVWNTLVRLTAFIAIGWTISRIQNLLTSEVEKGAELRRTMNDTLGWRGNCISSSKGIPTRKTRRNS